MFTALKFVSSIFTLAVVCILIASYVSPYLSDPLILNGYSQLTLMTMAFVSLSALAATECCRETATSKLKHKMFSGVLSITLLTVGILLSFHIIALN